MGLIENVTNNIRSGMQKFLQINNAPETKIILNERMTRIQECIKNRMWYAGNSIQLSEFYSQVTAQNTMFWKAQPTRGIEIRKLHTGLPQKMVDMIVNIILNDYNGIEISSDTETASAELWESIEKENKFTQLLKEALSDVSIVGDGAFKISYDEAVSSLPIIEWYSSENVEFKYQRGRIREIKFINEYVSNGKKYQFVELYGYGYIEYHLYNEKGNELPLNAIEQTSWADSQGVRFDTSSIWAVPVIYGKSQLYKGRGKSIIEGKEDAFDGLDEIWSQWMDSLRACRTQTYIPQNLVPYDENTGKPLSPNPFDNRFIQLASVVDENGHSSIHTQSPQIQSEAYLSAYITALDLCLQGVLSPSTLGIDVKKLDNAEAQREKEKTTLYTRQNFVELLETVLPQLVKSSLSAYALINKTKLSSDIQINVKFGEYANPSFESQVETVGKARQSAVMSIEQSIEELYGDSKDEDWKAEEVRKIKAEQGITAEGEPYELDDIGV